MSQLTCKTLMLSLGDATLLEGNEGLPQQVICERQEASLEQNALIGVSPPTVHPSNSHPDIEQQVRWTREGRHLATLSTSSSFPTETAT